uniref:FLYWCH-type domain-containing protein n=1 Tax=Meloidogyne hapla TaxID=6305 RepID=A0A1I8BKR2_MELHA
MYAFQRYDPSLPRTVCSFKGNQKLIFEGYRYNIHHIVPSKGVKTWRCVCAKKLNGTRSWCKGRAETCDNDGHGISKGEHNHPPEHESQLILAAIECPQANLNELIDEAGSLMMTGGSNFGNRESLKKSLAGARKQAENGGFKLKCYKNICYNKTTTIRNKNIVEINKDVKEAKSYNINDILNKKIIFENCKKMKTSPIFSSSSFCSSSSSPLFNNNNKLSSNSSSFSSSSYSSPPNNFFSSSSFLDSSFGSSSSSGNCSNNISFKDSPYFNFNSSSSFSSSSFSSPSNAFLMAIIAAATNSSNFTKNININENKQQLIQTPIFKKEEEEEKRKHQILLKKKERINFVFNRLSKKAAAAASTNNSLNGIPNEIEIKQQQKENLKEHEENDKNNCKEFGTQTEETCTINEDVDKNKNGEKLSNLIRVCCCEDKQKCTEGRRQKRKLLTPRMHGNGGCGDLLLIDKEDF